MTFSRENRDQVRQNIQQSIETSIERKKSPIDRNSPERRNKRREEPAKEKIRQNIKLRGEKKPPQMKIRQNIKPRADRFFDDVAEKIRGNQEVNFKIASRINSGKGHFCWLR